MSSFPIIFDSMSFDARGKFVCKIVELLGGNAVAFPEFCETREDISVLVELFLEETPEYQTRFIQEFLVRCSRIIVSFTHDYSSFKKEISSYIPAVIKECKTLKGMKQFWCDRTCMWWPLQWDKVAEENVAKAWWGGEIGKSYREDTKKFTLEWRDCYESYNFYFR